VIVLAGLEIESGSLSVQKEGADLTLLNETVKVAINGGETDPRQPFVNPPVNLMGERMGVIALEGFEHLLQLTCGTFAGRSQHSLPRILGSDRANVRGCGISNRGYAVKRFSVVASDKRRRGSRSVGRRAKSGRFRER